MCRRSIRNKKRRRKLDRCENVVRWRTIKCVESGGRSQKEDDWRDEQKNAGVVEKIGLLEISYGWWKVGSRHYDEKHHRTRDEIRRHRYMYS